jgi:hypothetical protein
VQLYNDLFELDKHYDEKVTLYVRMFDEFAFAYQQLKITEIKKHLSRYNITEKEFKMELKSTLENDLYKNILTNEDQQICLEYLNSDLVYFNGKYNNDSINAKNTILDLFYSVIQQSYFLKKKELLDFKIQLLTIKLP